MATRRSNQAETNWAAGIEGCLLVGIGTMLLRKGWDGQLPLYIHPRYVPLIWATALLVLLIGASRLWYVTGATQALRGRMGMYALLLAPVAFGVLIPARPAGSALVDLRQMNTFGRGYRTASVLAAGDSTTWTLLDWMFARYTLTPEEARGKPVDLVGFVYRAPDQPASEFYVARYVLSCCVADRSGVSLLVRWAGAAALHDDQWVRVTGSIELRPGADQPEFVIANAQVAQVEPPKEPYLYP
ncbi:MAG TPA: TIGR03943 family protein [Roseiflexaceae bacterium]